MFSGNMSSSNWVSLPSLLHCWGTQFPSWLFSGKMMTCLRAKENTEVKGETAFVMNGSILLKKLIAFCNGRCNPIRSFSAEELKKATNNYAQQQVIKEDGFFKLYKGFLQDRPITVKKFARILKRGQFAFNEIVYASQMSVHKNVLKLLGCCLETRYPILVFESAEENTLADVIHDHSEVHFRPIPWKSRLKIAVDIANVIVYLHTAFPRPVVYRNIEASNIFVDENYASKLSDFSLSLTIPEGESYVKDIVVGTAGFIAPESLDTGYFNEKNDVYSFGVFLLVLLTGQRAFDSSQIENGDQFLLVNNVKEHIKKNKLEEMVDPMVAKEGPWPGKEQQLECFSALALSCIHTSAEDRPEMIQVAKELRQMHQSLASAF